MQSHWHKNINNYTCYSKNLTRSSASLQNVHYCTIVVCFVDVLWKPYNYFYFLTKSHPATENWIFFFLQKNINYFVWGLRGSLWYLWMVTTWATSQNPEKETLHGPLYISHLCYPKELKVHSYSMLVTLVLHPLTPC